MTGLYLLGLISLHLALTLATMAAGTLSALALGIRNRLLLLMIGMVTFAALGMVVFWAYLASASLGRAVAIAAIVLSVLVTCLAGAVVLRQRRGRVLMPLLPPTALFAAYALFITAIGYLRGGVASGDAAGRNRFIAGLPTDSNLPIALARQLQDPHRPLPHYLLRPWQASDRPPLQTGVYLLEQGVLGHDKFIHYQAVGIVAQSLWIFGVWAFMVAVGLPNRANALALAVTAFSGFAIVNTFFVWPKLFPAAYLMIAAAALLGPYLKTVRRSIGISLAVGLCVGCAMMGHPGSLLVVFGLILTLAIARRWPSWRLLVGGIAGLILMYGPWTWFVKYYDPPAGNFLLRWQLAGIRNYQNPMSLTEAVISAYRKAGWSGTISNKLGNLSKPFKDTFHYPAELWQIIREHRFSLQGHSSITNFKFEISAFYYFIPALGLMSLGMLILVLRQLWLTLGRQLLIRRSARHSELAVHDEPEVGAGSDLGSGSDLDSYEQPQRIGMLALVCLVINWVVWSLILIGPGSTWVHAGSYFLELIGFCIGVIGWWLVSPRLCAVLVAVQSAIIVWIYGVQPPPHVSSSGPILDHYLPSVALLSALSLGLVLASLWWLSRQPMIGFETELAVDPPVDKSVSAEKNAEYQVVVGAETGGSS